MLMWCEPVTIPPQYQFPPHIFDHDQHTLARLEGSSFRLRTSFHHSNTHRHVDRQLVYVANSPPTVLFPQLPLSARMDMY
jgi:hypothetical protein